MEVVNFTPRPLYHQGKIPGTPWIGGWVGPRAVLDAVVKRKIPSPRRESNPRTPIVQPVAQSYTHSAVTALTSLDAKDETVRTLCTAYNAVLIYYGSTWFKYRPVCQPS
jgi:hypothetical protein